MAWIRAMGGGSKKDTKEIVIYDNGVWKDGFSLGSTMYLASDLSGAGGFEEKATTIEGDMPSWNYSRGSLFNGDISEYRGMILHFEMHTSEGVDRDMAFTIPMDAVEFAICYSSYRYSWTGFRISLGTVPNKSTSYLSQGSYINSTDVPPNGYSVIITKIYIKDENPFLYKDGKQLVAWDNNGYSLDASQGYVGESAILTNSAIKYEETTNLHNQVLITENIIDLADYSKLVVAHTNGTKTIDISSVYNGYIYVGVHKYSGISTHSLHFGISTTKNSYLANKISWYETGATTSPIYVTRVWLEK